MTSEIGNSGTSAAPSVAHDDLLDSFPIVPTASPYPSSSPYPTYRPPPPQPYYPPSSYANNNYDADRTQRSLILAGSAAIAICVVATLCYLKRTYLRDLHGSHEPPQPQPQRGGTENSSNAGGSTTGAAANRAAATAGSGVRHIKHVDKGRRAWIAQWLAPVQMVRCMARRENDVVGEPARPVDMLCCSPRLQFFFVRDVNNQVLTQYNFPETNDEPCGASRGDISSTVQPGDGDGAENDGASGIGERIRRTTTTTTTTTAVEERIRIPAPGLRLDCPEQTLWDESQFQQQGEASETIMSDERNRSMEPRHIDHRQRSSSPPPPPMRWAAGSCTICLASYQVGESVAWSSNPDCEHCFHTLCIEEWLLKPRPQKKRVPSRGGIGPTIISWVEGDSVPPCPNCRRDFIQDPFEEAHRRRSSAVPADAIDEINV
jgi:Ring finger domain